LLEKESSVKARYEVFKRLNKLGSPLSDQEIRNCTSRLLGKKFPTQLKKLGENPVIRKALSLSEDAERRMGVEEMLLRLLALSYSKKPLRHQVREYLDEFMAHAAEEKFKFSEEKQHRIEKTFALIQQALPNGKAFRFARSGFSTNLFDVVATGIFHNLDSLDTDTFIAKFKSLMKTSRLKELTGAGSNTKKKMQGRIDLGKEWFKN
jgi:hypothetical protein